MTVTPFQISVADSTLADLRERLAATRWPDAVEGAGWDYGTDLDYLRELVTYWQDVYDWRAAEAQLNRADHARVDVDGLGVHVVRQAARPESHRDGAPPLLLLHGWPDSFYRFHKLLPLLSEYDLVVPSLPGYGFSDLPTERGMAADRMGEVTLRVMSALGYERFVVHGGDIGSSVAEAMAMTAPERVLGMHLTDVPYWHLFTVDPAQLSDTEKAYLEAGQQWQMQEGAYALMQSTRPQTAAVGLNDSPAGLASWIVEKFRAWSDCDGDVESRFSKDELCTNLTIYWATQTIGSSFRVYAEQVQLDRNTPVTVPTGVAIFPKDIVPAPREFGERFYDVRRWTEMPRGGHFAALEEPELLADDIRTFVAAL